MSNYVSNYTFDNLSRIGQDNCSKTQNNIQNTAQANYTLNNFFIQDCGMKKPIEFATSQPNIFYNGNNIFNFRIPNLVSNLFSSNYTFVIRNNQLFIYKNKTTLMVKCALPSIFNIDILAIRTFNKDSWWIC